MLQYFPATKILDIYCHLEILQDVFLVYNACQQSQLLDYLINIDSQIQVEISVTKNGKPYSPDSLRVETMNKYNNDDSLETDLLPYVTGEYLFIFTPNYAGDYFININVSDDVINYNKVETITIK